jgi:hypothetical protein
LESQINVEIEPEGEWAVDRILSHTGFGENATFEVRWRAGDTTWLPYNQISHLQALATYLELLGVTHISVLRAGIGSPPKDDPQIYVGSITPYSDSDFSYISPSEFLPSPSASSDFSFVSHYPTDDHMTRSRKTGPHHGSSANVVLHPNFWRTGNRVIVKDAIIG